MHAKNILKLRSKNLAQLFMRLITTPAEVEAKMGLTINLGNYESLRVDVGVKMPCYKEEIEKAKVLAFQLVEKELCAKVREVKGSL